MKIVVKPAKNYTKFREEKKLILNTYLYSESCVLFTCRIEVCNIAKVCL